MLDLVFGTEGVDVHFVVDGFVHIKSFWLPIVKKKKKKSNNWLWNIFLKIDIKLLAFTIVFPTGLQRKLKQIWSYNYYLYIS